MNLLKLQRRKIAICVGLILPVCLLCAGWVSGQFERIDSSGYRVVAKYPHDRKSFTQGLIVHDGQLIEGTGQYGQSKIFRNEIKTGKPVATVSLPKQYFGEGIAVADGELFQLTWKEKVAFVYDADTLQYQRYVRYSGEGWGLTYDGESLILSDGTPALRFVDPKTFAVRKRLYVREGKKAVGALNELEFVEGEIWANIWYEHKIVRIDPNDGQVIGWIDLRGLKPRSLMLNRDAVCNGIAYDPDTRRLFVTGKNWPVLYEIEIVPPL